MRLETPAAVRPAERPLRGTVRVPGDKSISHRLLLLAAVARGGSLIRELSPAGDCAATIRALRALGVRIDVGDGATAVDGEGWEGLTQPPGPVHCGRSGTTMRLLAGVLAGSRIRAVLTGDAQLLRRPMDRVADPIRRMGAGVETSHGRPPVTVTGHRLAGIDHRLSVPSAQVKSAVLLAGLRASGTTRVAEPVATRDHTERALAWLGAPLERTATGGTARITVLAADLPAFEAAVPGDPSSAASLLAAAAVVPRSDVSVEGMGLNPTRTGFLRVLERMGARVDVREADAAGPEPIGGVRVRHASLRATTIEADEVPALIDELPVLGVVAALAEGTTEVRGAGELRVKESDRIKGLVAGLRALGADAEELADGFAVTGPARLVSATCDARDDHRLAMAFAVAALAAEGPVTIHGMESVADSFPGFVETVDRIR